MVDHDRQGKLQMSLNRFSVPTSLSLVKVRVRVGLACKYETRLKRLSGGKHTKLHVLGPMLLNYLLRSKKRA
jgi:hypothetical protein